MKSKFVIGLFTMTLVGGLALSNAGAVGRHTSPDDLEKAKAKLVVKLQEERVEAQEDLAKLRSEAMKKGYSENRIQLAETKINQLDDTIRSVNDATVENWDTTKKAAKEQMQEMKRSVRDVKRNKSEDSVMKRTDERRNEPLYHDLDKHGPPRDDFDTYDYNG